MQERDPRSLLNLYRRLLALHHGNAALRSGGLELLRTDEPTSSSVGADPGGNSGANSGGEQAVVWMRRAPAGSRTAAPVVVAVNCGDRPATLVLDTSLARLGFSESSLRSLLSGGQVMGRHRLLLAPHAVFVGELAPAH